VLCIPSAVFRPPADIDTIEQAVKEPLSHFTRRTLFFRSTGTKSGRILSAAFSIRIVCQREGSQVPIELQRETAFQSWCPDSNFLREVLACAFALAIR
jgi:hypothetical protein